MLNTVQTYADCGKRCADAMNKKDPARYAHEQGWLRSAVWLEKPEHRPVARHAYDEAYTANRNVPRPETFK